MNKEVVGSLIGAATIILLALGATLARQQGLIDTETVNRIVLGAIGLQLAWYGNQAPKRFVAGAAAQRLQRVSGWSMAISGLIYAVLWAFAPFEVALWVGCGAVAAGVAITVAYGLSLRGRCSAT